MSFLGFSGDNPLHFNNKVYAFDLDSTLIKPRKGKFSIGPDDWVWLYPEVPVVLRNLICSGSLIVIFTNQGGIRKNNPTREDFIQKWRNITRDLGFEPYLYAALQKDNYRKPATGMWDLFLEDVPYDIDKRNAVYVGDAAGRKGDFAWSDRFFAYNLGIAFQTPEEFFLGKKQVLPETRYPELFRTIIEKQTSIPNITPGKKVIFLVGPPGAGKSTFISKYPGATWINQDTLGTKAKVIKKLQGALKNHEFIILDKLFGDLETRQEYLELIPKDYEKIAVYFDVPIEWAEHMNIIRSLNTDQDPVPDLVYNIYKKNFVKPSGREGFDVIYDYVPEIDWTHPHIQEYHLDL